jgi:tetratricopeptide (TPR) repeat protein
LSTEVSGALRVASVIGREFDADLLLEATNSSLQELSGSLDEAVSAKVLQRVGIMRYQFKHALVRETIYESLPTVVRAEIHQAVAEALERRGYLEQETTLSLLAHHAVRALPCGSVERALDYLIRAGREARRRLAYEEAVDHYQRALELGGSRIAAEPHCDLLILLGEAQARAGLWLDSRHTFERAASEARIINSPTHFARAAIGFKGMIGGTSPVDQTAIALLREALTMLRGTESELEVKVLNALTFALYFDRAEAEMETYSMQALGAAARIGEATLHRTALEARLVSVLRPSRLPEVLDTAANLLARSREAGDKEMIFRAHLGRYVYYLELGDPVAATIEFDSAADVAEDTRDPRCLWQSALARSCRALMVGDLDGSTILTELARCIGEKVHDSSPTHYFMLQRFQQDRMRGELVGWEVILSEAIAQYPAVAGYRAAHAASLGAVGETGPARRALSLLAAARFRDVPCDALFLWTTSTLAEVCAKYGEVPWCENLYDLLGPYRHHNVVAGWGAVFDGSVAHFLGVLSVALGRFEEATCHFEFAMAKNAEMGAPLLVARTMVQYAELLLKRLDGGDEQLASDLLKGAIETMHRTGQAGYLARAEQLVGGIRSPICGSPAERLPLSSEAPVDGRRTVFRRESGFWTIVFNGEVLRIKDSRGLAYLACLLRTPRQDIHVLDLVAGVSGGMVARDGAASVVDGGGLRYGHTLGDAGPMADEKAREDYRRRLADIDAELAEAEEFNDLGRTPRLRLEREEIAAELKRAYGLNGRLRVTSSAAERARISVRNRITATIERIGRAHPSLRRHLEAAVRTGTYCSYRPERPVPWSF